MELEVEVEVEREGQGAGPCEVEGCALEEVEGDESQGMSALRADKQIVGNAAMAHNLLTSSLNSLLTHAQSQIAKPFAVLLRNRQVHTSTQSKSKAKQCNVETPRAMQLTRNLPPESAE